MSKQALAKAIQQPIGFSHAVQGGSIESLAEAMGLQLQEWLAIRNICPIKEDEKEALDSF